MIAGSRGEAMVSIFFGPRRRARLRAAVGTIAVTALLVGCERSHAPASGATSSDRTTSTSTSNGSAAPSAPAPALPLASTTPTASSSSNALPTAASSHGDGIAWRDAASDADVDAAFAVARAEHKPLFVYWGAKWCPPCNQVKAMLFNRQEFIARSRAFVPVYVDGDSPGAQKIGARFQVSGYPTMVLFSPDGKEVTRLPGEVEPVRYSEVLTLGMNASRPVGAVLADALARPSALSPNDWRLLAFYSWETDQQQLIEKDRLPATMARLADACPATVPDAAMRLRLKALAFADAKTPVQVDAATRAEVLAMLRDPERTRAQTDMVTNDAAEIVRAASARGTADRAALVAAFESALERLEADPALSRADRMQALIARVDLARIDEPEGKKSAAPRLPPALVADVREETARADREITNGYERQAVITAAAYVLERAGLGGESDALLRANLAKSHSPYYLMSELASNAKKRGDKAEALHWYREAYEKSEGPATRLQWGASYVAALVELAPSDDREIEAATTKLWSEAATQPDAFYMRSARSLQKVGERLQAWNRTGAHRATMARLEARLGELCASPGRSDAERATCTSLLAPTGATSKPAA
jgi:thioredoxin-related protein